MFSSATVQRGTEGAAVLMANEWRATVIKLVLWVRTTAGNNQLPAGAVHSTILLLPLRAVSVLRIVSIIVLIVDRRRL
jgi:hypothetical protein